MRAQAGAEITQQPGEIPMVLKEQMRCDLEMEPEEFGANGDRAWRIGCDDHVGCPNDKLNFQNIVEAQKRIMAGRGR